MPAEQAAYMVTRLLLLRAMAATVAACCCWSCSICPLGEEKPPCGGQLEAEKKQLERERACDEHGPRNGLVS